MKILFGAAFAAAAMAIVAPAHATAVPAGTLTVSAQFTPTVNLSTTPKSFSANNGLTKEIDGDGSFTSAIGKFGIMNGTFNFSSVVGASISQSLPNFLVVVDGKGGVFRFFGSKVTTISYFVTPSTTAIAVNILGKVLDPNLGYTATSADLTLSFNRTGRSPFSASATLAVAPEPATWAMMVGGFGLIGYGMRSRRKLAVRFA